MKYHNEGTNGQKFARIEQDQISITLAEEQMLKSPFIFGDIFRDAPMSKRFAIAAIIGVFGQWSGNALLSFYTPIILDAIGITNEPHSSLSSLAGHAGNWLLLSLCRF